jgi:hypothetical protein
MPFPLFNYFFRKCATHFGSSLWACEVRASYITLLLGDGGLSGPRADGEFPLARPPPATSQKPWPRKEINGNNTKGFPRTVPMVRLPKAIRSRSPFASTETEPSVPLRDAVILANRNHSTQPQPLRSPVVVNGKLTRARRDSDGVPVAVAHSRPAMEREHSPNHHVRGAAAAAKQTQLSL